MENLFIYGQVIFDISIIVYLLWEKYINSKLNKSYGALIASIKDLLDVQKTMIDQANKRIESQKEDIARVLEDIRHKNSVLTELIKSVKINIFEESTREKVLKMFEKQLSVEEIAKQLGIPKGEIDLILKLYKEVE